MADLSEVFGALAPLRDRPIPLQDEMRAKRANYRSHAIDRNHALAKDPLVVLSDFGVAGKNFYFDVRNPPYWERAGGAIPDLVARRSVVEKLARVNLRLRPVGLSLHVFDAWRPNAVQAYFHDVWMPRDLKRRFPDLSGEALTREVERYWAAPTENPEGPAPHATGAAVDLTLRWADGEMPWMGSIFDDVTALAHRDRLEKLSGEMSFSDAEARANRRLLHWLMAEEGFLGHPDEWWHFSWGDQYWARLSDASAAFYGFAEFKR